MAVADFAKALIDDGFHCRPPLAIAAVSRVRDGGSRKHAVEPFAAQAFSENGRLRPALVRVRRLCCRRNDLHSAASLRGRPETRARAFGHASLPGKWLCDGSLERRFGLRIGFKFHGALKLLTDSATWPVFASTRREVHVRRYMCRLLVHHCREGVALPDSARASPARETSGESAAGSPGATRNCSSVSGGRVSPVLSREQGSARDRLLHPCRPPYERSASLKAADASS